MSQGGGDSSIERERREKADARVFKGGERVLKARIWH